MLSVENYLVVSMVAHIVMTLIWSKDDLPNLFIKTLWVCLSLWAAVCVFGG